MNKKRMFFCDRYEDDKEIVITYNAYAYYIEYTIIGVGLWGAVSNHILIAAIAAVTMASLIIASSFVLSPIYSEITAAAKNENAVYTGKKYSLRNPITVRIAK